MSEDLTRILPNDNTLLQQVLTEVREMRAEVRALDHRLTVVEDKIDARSRETQPMSGRVDQLIRDVAETRQELRDGLAGVRAEVSAIRDERRAETESTRRELRDINRTLRRMNVDVARALDIQTDLEDRVVALEDKLEPVK